MWRKMLTVGLCLIIGQLVFFGLLIVFELFNLRSIGLIQRGYRVFGALTLVLTMGVTPIFAPLFMLFAWLAKPREVAARKIFVITWMLYLMSLGACGTMWFQAIRAGD